MVYGAAIGTLALLSFVTVAYIAGSGTAHTSGCNHDMTRECMHLFRARSAAFACLTSLLLLHAYNCKDLRRSLTHMRIADNRALMCSVLLGFVTLVPTFYVPLVGERVFYHAPIDWEWALVLGSAVLFVAFSEAYKAWVRPCIAHRKALGAASRHAAREDAANAARVEVRVEMPRDVGGPGHGSECRVGQ